MTKNVDSESFCNRMEQLINEFEQSRDPESTEIGRQFAQLQRTMMYTKDNYPTFEGAKPNNRLKNRYKDVLPYDQYRVVLTVENDSDYINASFIEDFDNIRRYIAAQGPIDQSITDFIRMIWEYQITSIICTANELEDGRFKFRRYWPDEETSLNFGSYRITKDETSDKGFIYEHYEVRPLIITRGENRRHVLLYHFLHWNDHDIPKDESFIFELISRLYKDRDLSPNTPILVHCSAGCGRTGTFIAIDLCRVLLENERLLYSKNYQPYPVFNIAGHIREFRIALIQTIKQYVFVHKIFVRMMKTNGHVSQCQLANTDENQAVYSLSTIKSSSSSNYPSTAYRPSATFPMKLRNPPVGRRPINGINKDSSASVLTIENHPSKSSSVNDKPQRPELKSPIPPPIPPRSSLLNATNKPVEGQFVRPGEIPIKAKRTIFRSRNFRGRNAKEAEIIKSPRSDSADALSVSSVKLRQRNCNCHSQNRLEKETNSD